MIQSRLSELLEARGRTLYWLSKQAGVRYQTVWNLGKGKSGRLELAALDRLCEALDCQPGDVLVRVANKRTKSKKKAR